MNALGMDLLSEGNGRISILELDGFRNVPSFSEDVRRGLSSIPKQISPKYFYDEKGSWLFEEICKTREYYPTRVEKALLAKEADSIIDRVRPGSILELGSGSSNKTTFLLDSCGRKECFARYHPLDVCEEMLLDAGKRLLKNYEWLYIEALVGDFSKGFKDLPPSEGPRLFVFLGGTIGNFDVDFANQFLQDVCSSMAREDWFLLGADRVKDVDVLNAAYNDSTGYTAAFNLNMLEVMNRELQANFDLSSFQHRAGFNQEKSQIEMYLDSNSDQTVRILDLDMEVPFRKGEPILTEISRKFTQQSLTEMLKRAGLKVDHHYQPDNGYFSLVLTHPE